MKLHFEPNLDYQMQAVEAVCDLFRGQELCRTEFTVTMRPDATQLALEEAQTDKGLGNRLTLLDDELLKNLNAVQLRGGLAPSTALTSGDFTVEMETGTGKTYGSASKLTFSDADERDLSVRCVFAVSKRVLRQIPRLF